MRSANLYFIFAWNCLIVITPARVKRGILQSDVDANLAQLMKHSVQHYDQKTVNFLSFAQYTTPDTGYHMGKWQNLSSQFPMRSYKNPACSATETS